MQLCPLCTREQTADTKYVEVSTELLSYLSEDATNTKGWSRPIRIRVDSLDGNVLRLVMQEPATRPDETESDYQKPAIFSASTTPTEPSK